MLYLVKPVGGDFNVRWPKPHYQHKLTSFYRNGSITRFLLRKIIR